MSDEQQDEKQRIRWGWVWGCFLGGAVVTAAAFIVPPDWNPQTPSVLINLGTALGLAGVLFLLERRFTGQVIRASERAVRRVASEVEQRFDRRAEELSARLDTVQDQVNERLRRRAAEQDAAVDAFGEAVSFDTVTELLTHANRLRAIDGGSVTVPGNEPPEGLPITFRWGIATGDSRQPAGPQLVISAPTSVGPDGGRPVVEVVWEPQHSAADIRQQLVEELMRCGCWQGPATLDWSRTLINLQYVIGIAVASRRRDPDAWHLKGEVIELLHDGWLITLAGLEDPERGYLLPSETFPAHETRLRIRPPGTAPDPEWQPARPDWVDPVRWKQLLQHARRYHPRSRGAALAAAGHWQPWTG